VGSLVGGAVGGLAGKVNGNAGKSVAIGSTVGLAIGALAGWSEHKHEAERKRERKFQPTTGFDAPSLTAPEVRRVWVPSQIEDNRYVTGHWMYIIQKQSNWRLDDRTEGASGK